MPVSHATLSPTSHSPSPYHTCFAQEQRTPRLTLPLALPFLPPSSSMPADRADGTSKCCDTGPQTASCRALSSRRRRAACHATLATYAKLRTRAFSPARTCCARHATHAYYTPHARTLHAARATRCARAFARALPVHARTARLRTTAVYSCHAPHAFGSLLYRRAPALFASCAPFPRTAAHDAGKTPGASSMPPPLVLALLRHTAPVL